MVWLLAERYDTESNEPDMQDTAGEVGTSSLGMYSYGPLHRVTSSNLHTTVL